MQLVGAECIFMRPCLSSFFFVWLCGHKFLPSLPPSLPVFLHLSPVFFWHAGQANPPLSTCSCSLFANFPPSFSQSPQPVSFIFLHVPAAILPYFHSLVPSAFCFAIFFVFKGQNHLYSLQLFSSLPFFPSFSSTTSTPPPLVPTLPPYRWRLTGESSAIRPRDCLLLRRWMEAPSASPTQPQLHQPP